MKWVGYQEWDVSRIKLPGEVAKRMKEPRVIALAESTDDLGGEPMNAPTVNADVSPPELVAGRDRMAATLLRKRKRVWVHVGKNWTPADLLKAEIHENLHRRHDDKAALTKALVDKAEAFVKAWSEADAEANALDESEGVSGRASQNSVGRPKTDRAKAQEIVADASGQSVAAVKKADQRAQARLSGEAGEPAVGAVTAPASPLIETYGHDLPDWVRDEVGPPIEAMRKIDQLLRQAQSIASSLFGVERAIADRVKEQLHDVAAYVRSVAPSHLCPYCLAKFAKGKPCTVCNGLGHVWRAVFDAAPKGSQTGNGRHGAQRDAATPERGHETPAAPPSDRHIPPIKAGVTYTVGATGDVVEQAPVSDIDRHIARAAKAKAPKRGMLVQIGDGPARPVGEVLAEIEKADAS